MRKFTLVKFQNGKFGVRSGWFSYKYFDKTGAGWSSPSNISSYCELTEEEARECLRILTDIGTPVREK